MKIFKGDFYRISVLTDKLIRLEYSKNGQFEDRHTQLIQNRDFGEVEVEATETPELLDINTKFSVCAITKANSIIKIYLLN